MGKHLIHKNSNVLNGASAKLPNASDVEYGELAINYLTDNETISLKNSSNSIVSFKSEKYNENKYVDVSGDTMTGQLNIKNNLNIGGVNTISGQYSFVQGSGNTVSGLYSFAQGSGNTVSGLYSFVQGTQCAASGICSHAEGAYSDAYGNYSHAEGNGTKANGRYSHAECYLAEAIGDMSHAEGWDTRAKGGSSHAEGVGTESNGGFSHAEGDNSVANGNTSHAEGSHTIANNISEHASGNYNISISGASQTINDLMVDSQATLFSIGNGVDEATRKNALEIKWNGDAYFSGDTTFAKGITANTIIATTITATTLSGNATSASKLQTPRTITLSGDISGVTTFDGSTNVVITNLITPTYAGSSSKGGAATSANKVNSALSFVAGTFAVDSFDGSVAKTVNVPTKTSNLTNDSDFATNADVSANNIYVTNVTGSANGTITFDRRNTTPLTFNSTHTHPMSEIVNLTTTLDTKVDNSTYNTYTAATNTSITNINNGKANVIHTHTIAQVDGLQGALDGKQAAGDYATNTALNNGLAGKADVSHTHGEYVLKAGDTMTGNLVVQGTISASTQIYSSDESLKENITIISDNDIDAVRDFSPKAYMFKEDSEHRVRYGTIAQELEKTKLSEMVYESEDGMKGVDYISYLVIKCEQLQRDLNSLQAKFEQLNK